MTTISSAHLTIAAGCGPGRAVVGVHGALGVPAAASLQRVLDGLLEDNDIVAISVDLHDVRGVDQGGISALAVAAERADERGAELTLRDPPEMLCQALESEGLTGIIRMVQGDRPPSWSATEVNRRRARRNHPSAHLLLAEGPEVDKAHGT